VRVLALHPDVVVVTSGFWQTNAMLVRHGDEAFLVDSPVLPEELDALPAVAEQAGFPVVGLLATHADWDHLLGGLAFPAAALGCAESTARRLAAEPGRAQRAMREFDDDHYVVRARPLSLGGPQALPVPGHCAVGDAELELHPTPGHTADGMAMLVPWARVLACGDYLSPVEIPMLSPGGSPGDYLATLDVLEGLLDRADTIVPGHGEPIDAARAAAILREDRAYLEGLRDGAEVELPLARRTPAQRRIHEENVSRIAGP